ncbi:hypothetical protein FKM82_027114 [Ascaphus truei]
MSLVGHMKEINNAEYQAVELTLDVLGRRFMARASDNIDCSDNEESLIQTRPISRGSDYSYDLFDSFTDGSSGEEESDSFETFSEKESDQLSLSETASSKSEIVEDTSGQLYQGIVWLV